VGLSAENADSVVYKARELNPEFPELLISRVGRLVGRGVDLKDLIAKGVQCNRFVRRICDVLGVLDPDL